MFEAIATGKNEAWGKKGEKVLVGDRYTIVGIRHGWLTEKIKFVGPKRRGNKRIYPQETK